MASQKIYTRRGDLGETSLADGTSISKSDVRLHAYGTVDELNAVVGSLHANLSVAKKKKPVIGKFLKDLDLIQNQLFVIGSHLACVQEDVRSKLPGFDTDGALNLEKKMDELNRRLPELKNFVLPGEDILSAQFHLARVICRRAERWTVELKQHDASINENIVIYLNRLSDYFFVMARYALIVWSRRKERIWVPSSVRRNSK